MAESPRQDNSEYPNTAVKTIRSHRIRCFKQGLGSSAEQSNLYGRSLVSTRDDSPYQLSGDVSCLSGNKGIWQKLEGHYSPDPNGQLHSSDIHQSEGGTCSRQLCQLAINVWNWCLERNIMLLAEHLPGKLNQIADIESRTVRDRCDWMLNPVVFQRILTQMGPLEVDLFASRLTRQLPRFYSWRPDPEAEATDAFLQDWSIIWGFANPPWCLIHRCLTKVKAQAARMVLVAPLWKTQSWFPVLLELLEDYPRALPQQPDLIMTPSGQEFLMHQGIPQLIAWPISGNPIHQKDFLQRLQISCSPHGDPKQTPIMVPPLPDGLAGVSKGIEIPFRDL